MYMYVRLQVHLVPSPCDSKCMTVSVSVAVFVSVFVSVSSMTAPLRPSMTEGLDSCQAASGTPPS